MRALRIIASQTRKDLVVWYRRPVMILATLAPSLAYLFIVFFVSLTIGHNRVALVIQDPGPEAARLAAAVESSDGFISQRMSAQGATAAMQNMDVTAIITIPASFDASLAAGHPSPVVMAVNNVNADETDDLRRSLPAAITAYYAGKAPSALRVGMTETDIHATDFSLGQFQFIPIVVFLITVSGIISAGIMACQEWEQWTIKELLMSPAGRWVIVAAKLLSGWIMTTLLASVVIMVGAALGFLRLPPGALIPCAAIVLLVALTSTCLGTTLGIASRRMGAVQALGVQIAVNLFFLSGGISVSAFLPPALQSISRGVPTYYAVHALDREILYNSSTDVVRDAVVVIGVTVVAIAVSIITFRRRVL